MVRSLHPPRRRQAQTPLQPPPLAVSSLLPPARKRAGAGAGAAGRFPLRLALPVVALALAWVALWLVGCGSPLEIAQDAVWRFRYERRRYYDQMSGVPCASLFPLRHAHRFDYRTPLLPDYAPVRALFDAGRRGEAHRLCSSGQVWLGYATAAFRPLDDQAAIDPALHAAMRDTQSAVRLLRADLAVDAWPPSDATLARWTPEVREAVRRHVRSFVVDFTYESNRIEGSRLTREETRAVLRSRNRADSEGGTGYLAAVLPSLHVDAHEAADHASAWEWIHSTLLTPKVQLWQLTEQHIRQLHGLVTQHTLVSAAGVYRQGAMVVHEGAMIAPQAAEVEALMGALVRWLASLHTSSDPYPPPSQSVDGSAAADHASAAVSHAALLHLFFVNIHPFDDGNGRTARLLLNYALLSAGLPPVNIRADEATQRRYMVALQRFSTDMDPAPFVQFVHEQMRAEIDSIVQRVRAAEEMDTLDRRARAT